jgi:thiol-disulfide isomerase/thioredoxin
MLESITHLPKCLFSLTLIIALGAHLQAASVPDLLVAINESIDQSDLNEPGNTKRAEAIADMLGDDVGLAGGDVIDLRLALGEAWIGAGRSKEAEEAIRPVFADKSTSAEQRERAGLGWIAIWQLRATSTDKPAELPTPMDSLAPFGDLGVKVEARAHSAAAEQAMTQKAPGDALTHLDAALGLLKSSAASERVPLYALRLLAMEQSGAKPEEVQAWLKTHASDPATVQVSASALTSGQRLVGQQVPTLKAKRLDGQAGELDLSAYSGKPILIAFFATWAKSCDATSPAVAAFAKELADKGLVTIGVSLDTADTVTNLASYLARQGIEFPIIGEGFGWDGELDDVFYVESIPTLILIGPDGVVAAVDLAGTTADETLRNLHAGYDALSGSAKTAEDVEAIP